MAEILWNIDWHSIFMPTISLGELVIRSTLMYFILFGLLRLVLKRQAGGIGTTDVLVIVLLADVSSQGFTSDYTSVVEGTIIVATVLFWSYVLEWAGHKYPAVERILRAQTLMLIQNGKMLRKNMRAELITSEELMAQLRKQGIEDCSQVKRAYMEADGKISVVKMNPD